MIKTLVDKAKIKFDRKLSKKEMAAAIHCHNYIPTVEYLSQEPKQEVDEIFRLPTGHFVRHIEEFDYRNPRIAPEGYYTDFSENRVYNEEGDLTKVVSTYGAKYDSRRSQVIKIYDPAGRFFGKRVKENGGK